MGGVIEARAVKCGGPTRSSSAFCDLLHAPHSTHVTRELRMVRREVADCNKTAAAAWITAQENEGSAEEYPEYPDDYGRWISLMPAEFRLMLDTMPYPEWVGAYLTKDNILDFGRAVLPAHLLDYATHLLNSGDESDPAIGIVQEL